MSEENSRFPPGRLGQDRFQMFESVDSPNPPPTSEASKPSKKLNPDIVRQLDRNLQPRLPGEKPERPDDTQEEEEAEEEEEEETPAMEYVPDWSVDRSRDVSMRMDHGHSPGQSKKVVPGPGYTPDWSVNRTQDASVRLENDSSNSPYNARREKQEAGGYTADWSVERPSNVSYRQEGCPDT